MSLPVWLGEDLAFPDPALSHHQGLVALGGDLTPERLRLAYSMGIFPWFSEDDPVMWWSPDPRTIFIPQAFHLSGSMRKVLRRHDFIIRINSAFSDIVQLCASIPRREQDGTWITPAMQAAYCRLHEAGDAHSIEVWQASPVFIRGTSSGRIISDQSGYTLAGGVYGVLTGSVFCGESMFSLVPNASKIALAALMYLCIRSGILAVDCQFTTSHLESLGAFEIPRQTYLDLLETDDDAHSPEHRFFPSSGSLFASPDWAMDLIDMLGESNPNGQDETFPI